MATFVFYFYVRCRYTLHGGYFGYSLVVLIVEFMGATNMVSSWSFLLVIIMITLIIIKIIMLLFDNNDVE